MTWLRKMRPVLIAVGLAVGIGALIGARSRTGESNSASAKPGDNGTRAAPGLYVLGTVDTDPTPTPYGLPPVLPSGTVTKVHVKEGDEVKVDQKLYEFDATIQVKDVKRAEAAVKVAGAKLKEADEFDKQHTASLKFAAQAVEKAKREVKLAYDLYLYVDRTLEDTYRKNNNPRDTWEELKKSSLDLVKANVDHAKSQNALEVAQLKHEELKTADAKVKRLEAEAAVELANAELEKAQSAVDLCVVKAKSAGIVEHITIGPGTTMGVSTRAPALWLIPKGARVVRAEVEAEFAHRVGPELEGKTVTIYDHTDPKLTYSGTVRRVPPVFMLKRASAENFLGGDTRVIETLIDVTDPAPHGKPPLRVGQRVRVNLGQ